MQAPQFRWISWPWEYVDKPSFSSSALVINVVFVPFELQKTKTFPADGPGIFVAHIVGFRHSKACDFWITSSHYHTPSSLNKLHLPNLDIDGLSLSQTFLKTPRTSIQCQASFLEKSLASPKFKHKSQGCCEKGSKTGRKDWAELLQCALPRSKNLLSGPPYSKTILPMCLQTSHFSSYAGMDQNPMDK